MHNLNHVLALKTVRLTPAGARLFSMLAGLITLAWLVSTSLVAGAHRSDFSIIIPNDAVMNIFQKLGFADNYQLSYVSKGFRILADEAIRSFWGIQHGKRTFLNYSLLLRELETMVKDVAGNARGSGSAAEVNLALKASVHFVCIQSVLEAEFGYCVSYAEGLLPRFDVHQFSLDVLNDERKVSIVPYILDQMVNYPMWIYLIQGLIDLGRIDLLGQLAFPRIDA